MKVLKILGLIFMIAASAVGGAALRLMEVLNDPNPLPVPKASLTKAELPEPVKNLGTESESVAAAPTELAVGETQKKETSARSTVNVLIVGLDNVEGGSRTDAIALAIFDAENRALRIASIPRDSRVYIPGRSWDKINHAYVYGGINLLRESLVNLTGMPVDYFVKINYKSFPRIVDILGGIDIYVEKRMHYNDYSGKLFINIPAGQQHMDGKTALGYVRFRHDPLGDIGRVRRQQKFIDTMMKKLKTPSIIPRIPAIVNELFDAIDTDLAPLEALKLVQFANSIPPDRIKMFMAPGRTGSSKNISYWILDNNAFSLQLAAKLPPADDSGVDDNDAIDLDLTPETVDMSGFDSEKIAQLRDQILSIRILNGDGEKGIGKRAAQIFQRIGIEVPYTGNARHYDYRSSSIIYPPSDDESVRQGALALAELCGITNEKLIQPDKRAASLTLILGHDKEELFKRLEPLNS
ncbi:MAG: LCP family protein [Synergistaceae bacterium]|nr:LCP family protein [Synergistaceae bacterium]MBQ9574100.1 LCP family protein [Synergistaceae bacterium]